MSVSLNAEMVSNKTLGVVAAAVFGFVAYKVTRFVVGFNSALGLMGEYIGAKGKRVEAQKAFDAIPFYQITKRARAKNALKTAKERENDSRVKAGVTSDVETSNSRHIAIG